jgi:crossover junction endodeoxyribonuclease RuvC
MGAAMILLGVDPGSQRTGYGVIESDGRRHRLLEMGVLAPPASGSLAEKLLFIHDGLSLIVGRVHPDALAVEDLFHAVNTRTALVLGHVRGVVLLAGAEARLPVHAFSPASVKAQITGFGRAEKRQVALMVSRLLTLPADIAAGDATDALAVALCLAHQAPRNDALAAALAPPARGAGKRA